MYLYVNLASDGVYMAVRVTADTVCSYHAFSTLPHGGIFLLHFP